MRAILLICFFASSLLLHAQVQQTWLTRYNGPTNGWDSATCATVDSGGNVYVAGSSETSPKNLDYLTAKYLSNGTLLWATGYNGSGNSNDVPAALKVDTAGNVYVTGTSRGPTNGDDIVTVKYDPAGNQLWTARYTSSGIQTDSAAAMQIGSSGDIYVAGSSSNGFTYITIKYNSSGAEVWKAFFIGTNGNANVATSLALDSLDNVYVTGSSTLAYFSSSYATVKYNSNGNQVWAAYYRGLGGLGGLNDPVAVSVDTLGNVYATGRSEELSNSGRYDYATVKYSSGGTQLWAAKYGSLLGGRNDMARSLAVDASGSVYVTGTSSGVSGMDFLTIKYSSSGTQLWQTRYNGPSNGNDTAAGLMLDSFGNAYVVGSAIGPGAVTNLTTLKYANDGIQLWAAQATGNAASNLICAPIVLGVSNEVYVCGEIAGLTASRDMTLIRYDHPTDPNYPAIITQPTSLSVIRGSNASFTVTATGAPPLNYRWNFNGQTQAVATTQTLLFPNVQIAHQGDYSVQVSNFAGSVRSALVSLTVNYLSNHPQSQLIAQGASVFWKVDPIGTAPFSYQWQFNGLDIPSATNSIFFLTNVQPLNAGWYSVNVSNVAGVMPSSKARLSVNTRVRQIWADARDPGYSIGLDPSANIYVTGSTGDCITAKFTPDGSRVWRATYNGPANGFDGLDSSWTFRGRMLVVDAQGNSYITATSKGVQGVSDSDYVTIKYDTNGNPLWTVRLDGSPANEYTWPVAIALDPTGNVLVTGTTGSYPTNGYLTVKYDNDGNQLWVTNRFYAGPAAHELAVNRAGEAYVTGRNGITVKYDPSGNQIWTASFYDPCWAMGFDSQTNMIIVGQAYLSESNYDYLTTKYDRMGTFLWSQRYPDSGQLWEAAHDVAVDTDDNIYVTGAAGTAKYSTPGVRLWVSPISGSDLKLDTSGAAYLLDPVSGFPSGTDYCLRKIDANGNRLWEVRYATLSNESPAALAIDNNGNTYVTGSAGTVKYSEFPVPLLQLAVTKTLSNRPPQFVLTGEAGRFFSIEASVDLVTWTTLTNLVNSTGTLSFSDPVASDFNQRFYRAVLDF